MATNKRLIEQYKYVHRKAQEITPAVYASIAIPLVEKLGWTPEEVEWLFQESQTLWQENVSNRDTMVEHCRKLTGIDLVAE